MFFINQGRTRGTTFKIDTGGYVFSCLFDMGAEVSCMNVDTCTALGLLDSISDTNTHSEYGKWPRHGHSRSCYGHIQAWQARVLLINFLFVDFLQDLLF